MPRASVQPSATPAQVFHFAAQVAVTTSLVEPRHDYEVNIGGTLNLLEAIRAASDPPPLLFTSTNKVYGALSDLALQKNCTRYQPLDASLRTGISEERPLDFQSPYGCSKGAADQYVLDYARTFGIARRGVPHELHLRSASDGHGRSGLGGALLDAGHPGPSRS